jgi:hypothetical protein
MENNVWEKGVVIGIIILFLWTIFLPGVHGNLVNVNTTSNNINNSTGTYTIILIGLITLTEKISHQYVFYAHMVFLAVFYDGYLGGIDLLINYPYKTGVPFDYKIGIVTNHIICGIFVFTIK